MRASLSMIAACALGLSGCQDSLRHLETEIVRLGALSGGTVGVAAIHLETAREVHVNAEQRFPMASSYKVPIAVQLLTRVDRGELDLDSLIEAEPTELYVLNGTSGELVDTGTVLPVREFLELMLLLSDNSAAGVGLRLAGGGEAVTERMRAIGIDGIRVDRPAIELISAWRGVPLHPNWERNPSVLDEMYRAMTPEQRDSAHAVFDRDPRDTATPEAMAILLAKLWRGEILSDSSRVMMLDLMRWSTTGAHRIRGMLTPDLEVAHKTGTLGGTTNDVGIVSLPNNTGHVAIAVFIKGSKLAVSKREPAIAHIARAIHDYFVFHPGPT